MFIQAWSKYLPVIKILLKRSINESQTLNIDKTDFQRATGGKKVKFTFSIVVVKNYLKTKETSPQLVKDLFSVLQQDVAVQDFLRKGEFELSMNSSFQLSIKHIASHETVEPVPSADMDS